MSENNDNFHRSFRVNDNKILALEIKELPQPHCVIQQLVCDVDKFISEIEAEPTKFRVMSGVTLILTSGEITALMQFLADYAKDTKNSIDILENIGDDETI